MVTSFLNLMANRKAETICARLHFSCYMMVARCLSEHVATLRSFSTSVRICHFFFFLSALWRWRLQAFTKNPEESDLCILSVSCLWRVRKASRNPRQWRVCSPLEMEQLPLVAYTLTPLNYGADMAIFYRFIRNWWHNMQVLFFMVTCRLKTFQTVFNQGWTDIFNQHLSTNQFLYGDNKHTDLLLIINNSADVQHQKTSGQSHYK